MGWQYMSVGDFFSKVQLTGLTAQTLHVFFVLLATFPLNCQVKANVQKQKRHRDKCTFPLPGECCLFMSVCCLFTQSIDLTSSLWVFFFLNLPLIALKKNPNHTSLKIYNFF